MQTIWLPVLLILLAIALIIFGPSQIGRLLAGLRNGAGALLSRLRALARSSKPIDDRRSSKHAKMRRL